MKKSVLVSVVLVIVVAIIILGIIYYISTNELKEPYTGIGPVNGTYHNLTYADWSAKWWQWAGEISTDNHPLMNSTVDCKFQQEGPVWFLGGAWGKATVERTCTIPFGDLVFFPVYNGECSFPEAPKAKSYEDLLTCVRKGNVNVDEGYTLTMYAEVDGHPVINLDNYKVHTELFNITWPERDVFSLAFVGQTQAVGEGWYLMLNQLSEGEHIIKFKFLVAGPPQSASWANDITYRLSVINDTKTI
jgi:hypothetical protein